MTNNPPPAHFEDKDAIAHVIEKHAEGVVGLAESHGTEMPGHLSAAADAARETSLAFLLISLIFTESGLSQRSIFFLLGAFSIGWIIWKSCRSSWLGWSRLERLHRVIEQEKYEIENHRPQEREELAALYRAKGFEGELLEEVLDVLMADGDRLLKVMLEEELGLKLEVHEHPLKQAIGAFTGAALSLIPLLIFYITLPHFGTILASLIILGGASWIAAAYEKNRVIPAMVWNMAMGGLAYGVTYFFLSYFKTFV